ncbi:MAG TPA: hydrogenase expression/formation protein [Sedimenticola sp.]|nr:hydrogenase expression/formation protein [Sedimenticola sp.]
MRAPSIESIPIHLTGPGSQPEETDGARPETLDLPREIAAYRPPELPGPERVAHLQGARAAAEWLRQALAGYRAGDPSRVADITALDPESRALVNQILAEGEVSLVYRGGLEARMQESILAGLWRVIWLAPDGTPARGLIEVCDVPRLARHRLEGEAGRPPEALDGIEAEAGLMNAMPILSELRHQLGAWKPGDSAYVVNLTQLPLSEQDAAFLERVLGRGPVETLARGYGECHIVSTGFDRLWWVRYHNNLEKLILNTLEVVDIPAVACAAPEDLADSRQRLEGLLEPYWQDLER